ncbi:hypothetical protein CYMTET_9468 [Cymbomonas tetramitiformis]|uniref:Protein arginine N-methyltransferase domain-containing protein n=1 Tax=Cymbomonas tetramitiformis TaxID=36881 RepID=A0AAE0GRE9_9CHLO|nr:hypothetical protein CYMTET_9468 [Cymbomonas tetramitiformis]
MLLAEGLATPLCAPFDTLSFDFRSREEHHEQNTFEVFVTQTGTVHAVLMWWALRLDGAGKYRLSTAPRQHRGLSDQKYTFEGPPRDHWRQAACVFPHPVAVVQGEILTLCAAHDGEAPTFTLAQCSNDGSTQRTPRGLELPMSFSQMQIKRKRMSQLNFNPRSRAYFSAVHAAVRAAQHTLEQAPEQPLILLCLGDGPLCPIAAAKAAKDVEGRRVVLILVQASSKAMAATQELLEGNGYLGVAHLEVVFHLEEPGVQRDEELVVLAVREHGKVHAVLSEPVYDDMQASGAGGMWALDHAVRLWMEIDILRQKELLHSSWQVFPPAARLMGVAVNCEELWRRRQPLQVTEGVDMQAFNELAPRPAGDQTLWVMDIGPWWRAFTLLSEPFIVAEVDFTVPFSLEAGARFEASSSAVDAGTCHGVCLWMDSVIAGTPSGPHINLPDWIASQGMANEALWTCPEPVAVSPTMLLEISLSIGEAKRKKSIDDILRRGVESTWHFAWQNHVLVQGS